THREDLQKVSADLRQCASWLKFHHYYRLDDVRLAAAYTCKRHLVCPFCAARRGSKTVERYLDRLAIIAQERPRARLALLTLTVKNGPDLVERHAHLERSWKTLQKRRRDYLNRGTGFTELAKVSGALFSYEVTNKGKGWHPHLHAIVLLDDWLDQEKLSAEWHRITGDSFIVDIRRIGKRLDALVDPTGAIVPEVIDAFTEVSKYALKFSDLSFANNLHAFETLRGKRLQGAFGAFWGVKVPESLLDDLLADEPYLELVYRFNGKSYDLTSTREATPHQIVGKLSLPQGGERTEGGAETEHRTDARTPPVSDTCIPPLPQWFLTPHSLSYRRKILESQVINVTCHNEDARLRSLW
ncbi:protein rep, partial [Geodermatophilus aquaeductus]